MYYKEIEASTEKKQLHDAAQKRVAGDRALARADYNRKVKKDQK